MTICFATICLILMILSTIMFLRGGFSFLEQSTKCEIRGTVIDIREFRDASYISIDGDGGIYEYKLSVPKGKEHIICLLIQIDAEYTFIVEGRDYNGLEKIIEVKDLKY